jgi:hypothetical protein
LRSSSILATRLSSSVAHDPYVKPVTVSQWEKLAEKELSNSKKSVDSLRTERITPVSYVPKRKLREHCNHIGSCNTSIFALY